MFCFFKSYILIAVFYCSLWELPYALFLGGPSGLLLGHYLEVLNVVGEYLVGFLFEALQAGILTLFWFSLHFLFKRLEFFRAKYLTFF